MYVNICEGIGQSSDLDKTARMIPDFISSAWKQFSVEQTKKMRSTAENIVSEMEEQMRLDAGEFFTDVPEWALGTLIGSQAIKKLSREKIQVENREVLKREAHEICQRTTSELSEELKAALIDIAEKAEKDIKSAYDGFVSAVLNELVKQKESAQQVYGKMEEIRQAAQVDLPRLYAKKKRLEQLQQDRPGRLIIDQLADSGQEDMDIYFEMPSSFLKKGAVLVDTFSEKLLDLIAVQHDIRVMKEELGTSEWPMLHHAENI